MYRGYSWSNLICRSDLGLRASKATAWVAAEQAYVKPVPGLPVACSQDISGWAASDWLSNGKIALSGKLRVSTCIKLSSLTWWKRAKHTKAHLQRYQLSGWPGKQRVFVGSAKVWHFIFDIFFYLNGMFLFCSHMTNGTDFITICAWNISVAATDIKVQQYMAEYFWAFSEYVWHLMYLTAT